MPYVIRDPQGQLLSLHRLAEAGALEFLPDEAPEIQAFVTSPHAGEGQRFAALDADFVRVLEDLVDVLIRRNVINLTDLPEQAREKLYMRKGHRFESSLSQLNLLGDSDHGALELPLEEAPALRPARGTPATPLPMAVVLPLHSQK